MVKKLISGVKFGFLGSISGFRGQIRVSGVKSGFQGSKVGFRVKLGVKKSNLGSKSGFLGSFGGPVYIMGGGNPTRKALLKTPFTLPDPWAKIEDFSNPALTPLTPNLGLNVFFRVFSRFFGFRGSNLLIKRVFLG